MKGAAATKRELPQQLIVAERGVPEYREGVQGKAVTRGTSPAVDRSRTRRP